ncbi:MAG: Membrane sensor protein UhpC [Chlamydiae bacterium]|nr:Membrane sensor protein UhpC [Chlamydiota bacterium]
MKIFSFLKPAPPEKEITDENEVKQSYKYWRWRTFYGMYVGYVFYYFSRKSFTFAMPSLMNDLGFDKGDLGILASILSLSYGASKFLSGVLSDRANPRFFMSIGLICTGFLNILFGLSSSILFFAIFWGLNGYFQGYGWPPCARLLTHWYSQKERGTWWGFWNTSHSVGGALIPLVAALCAQFWGWRFAMYVPGVLCIIAGLFLLNRLRDTPQSLGLPPIEKFKNDYPEKKEEEESGLSANQILFKHVLKNKFIWILALSYFFVYVIRIAINDWSALYLVESKGYSLLMAGGCVFWFEIGGIFGSLVAGWASDKIFGGKRGPINVLFSLGVIFALSAFWFSPAGLPILDSLLMFVIGFLIFGPQMLIGMVAAELAGKKAAGSATGFVGFVAYIGAATAGYPLGMICEGFGWQGFFFTIGLCGVLSVCLLLPLWKVGGTRSAAMGTSVKSKIDDDDTDLLGPAPTN